MIVDRLSFGFAKMAVAHAYEKHHVAENTFNDPRFGSPMNIKSPQDLKDKLTDILENGSNEIVMTEDRTAFYNEENNVYVILDHRNPVQSTAYRPNNGVRKIRAFKDAIRSNRKDFKRLDGDNLERKAVSRHIRKQMTLYKSFEFLPVWADALFDNVVNKFNVHATPRSAYDVPALEGVASPVKPLSVILA